MTIQDPINDILDRWKAMLSRCYAFQTAGEETWTAAEVLERIHDDEFLPRSGTEFTAAELAERLPCAIVWTETVDGYTIVAGHDSSSYLPSGIVVAEFFRFPQWHEDNQTKVTRTFLGQMLRTGDSSYPGLVELTSPDLANTLGLGTLSFKKLRTHGPILARPSDWPQVGLVQMCRITAEWN